MNEYIYYFTGDEHFRENIPLRSLLYGEGVFETFRCLDFNLPVYYERHISRLKKGCECLSIPFPDWNEIRYFIEKSLKSSGIRDAYVKLCVCSQGETLYYSVPTSNSIILIVKQYSVITEGIKLDIADYTKNSHSLITQCKSFNYLENILLKRKTIKNGYDEALILNEDKLITECIAHNIFWYSGGTVYTPSINSGILPGITRSVFIDTIKSTGMPLVEGLFTVEDLLSSTSVFLTNSISGIIKVYSIKNIYMCSDDYIFKELKQDLLTKLRWI